MYNALTAGGPAMIGIGWCVMMNTMGEAVFDSDGIVREGNLGF